MNTEKWNELCFLLSENIEKNISEAAFEQNVIFALRVLGWKEFSGDFDIRPSYQIGASNKITPDFVVKSSDKQKLFVVEIKQPSIPLTTRFQQQLFSYMRQLKLEYGLLVGEGIQIFYDGNLSKQDDPVLLETIKFERDSKSGENFVELFSKENFSFKVLQEFTSKSLKDINRKANFKSLVDRITSDSFKQNIFSLIKQELLNEYDGELIDSVFEELEIDIKQNTTEDDTPSKKAMPVVSHTPSNKYSRDHSVLKIELDPADKHDFLKALLIKKEAYITTFYENGTQEKKIWKVNQLKESSDIIANLRSRPEFRNGGWQKRGIIKVYVTL